MFPFVDEKLHQMLVKWIGKTACDAGTLIDIGTACKGTQALNMGLVVLALLAIGLTAAWLNARRRRRRSGFYII
jgi:hypothetical protein